MHGPLVGSDRPSLVTSATGLVGSGRIATERGAPTRAIPRVASEEAAASVAARAVRVSQEFNPRRRSNKGIINYYPPSDSRIEPGFLLDSGS